MSGRWWRAYNRARHDPKLLRLSDKHFRWWFNLLCVASDNDGRLPDHGDLCAEFRVSAKAMTDILDALVSAGLLDHDETGIRPHNWSDLQYKSDVSTDRVKRFRKRSVDRSTTVSGNVSVTPSESESESETDSEPVTTTESGGGNARARRRPPTQVPDDIADEARKRPTARSLPDDWQPSPDDAAWAAKMRPDLDAAEIERQTARFCAHQRANYRVAHDWSQSWRGWLLSAHEPSAQKRSNGKHTPPEFVGTAEPWEQRLRGYKPGGFWQESTWGPRPESGHCRAPREALERAGIIAGVAA